MSKGLVSQFLHFRKKPALVAGFFMVSCFVLLPSYAENITPANEGESEVVLDKVQDVKKVAITPEEMAWIGSRIYANECASKPENLVHWNEGESFPSLGIGHFIWYPVNSNERFVETFPRLFSYLATKHTPPAWLVNLKQDSNVLEFDAPWQTKQQLLAFKQTPQYREFIEWLLATQAEQAEFISLQLYERVAEYFIQPTLYFSVEQMLTLRNLFNRMMTFKEGRFALIDYANFKGVGAVNEAYQGEQWGLISVLEDMLSRNKNLSAMPNQQLLQEFIVSAKYRLQKRVELSPVERGEKRWIKGWFIRLDSYQTNK